MLGLNCWYFYSLYESITKYIYFKIFNYSIKVFIEFFQKKWDFIDFQLNDGWGNFSKNQLFFIIFFIIEHKKRHSFTGDSFPVLDPQKILLSWVFGWVPSSSVLRFSAIKRS